MVYVNPIILIITLNVNDQNTNQKADGVGIDKKDPTVCSLQELYLRYEDVTGWKKWEKIFYAKSSHRRAETSISTFMSISNICIKHIYAHNKDSKYMKQKLTEWKEQR